ncbi:MAG: SDR family NAD(P)-dependent oxidoreductase [Oligoflexales bacterium]|nr:SDR family NAD(P)-dependent oxidoreductase [Oligoflexales bacterium]
MSSKNLNLALITGTSSGVGFACAEKFLAEDWCVLGVARKAVTLTGEYYHFQSDLNKSSDRKKLIKENILPFLSNHYSQLVLINNAATLEPIKPLANLEINDFEKALSLNVVAPCHLIQLFLQSGKFDYLTVINLSSGAAENAYASWTAYCTSKAALSMLSRCLVKEYQVARKSRKTNTGTLRVIDYAPGIVDTPMQTLIRTQNKQDFPEVDKFIGLYTEKQLLSPKEVAEDLFVMSVNKVLPEYLKQRFPWQDGTK